MVPKFRTFFQKSPTRDCGSDCQKAEAMQRGQEMLKYEDKLVEEIFSHEDKDKNGSISHEESSWSKPKIIGHYEL